MLEVTTLLSGLVQPKRRVCCTDYLKSHATICLTLWPSDRLGVAVWLFDSLTVWQPDCLNVWLSDCLTAWLPDCLTVWLSDCLTAWLSDCLTVWQSDCLTFWLSDFLTVWLSDCLTVWLSDCLTVIASTDQLKIVASVIIQEFQNQIEPQLEPVKIEKALGWVTCFKLLPL